jgi:hypothetical protein
MTNLLPDLAPWDYELLEASIARYKVLIPVLKDEFGNTIDRHQRVSYLMFTKNSIRIMAYKTFLGDFSS